MSPNYNVIINDIILCCDSVFTLHPNEMAEPIPHYMYVQGPALGPRVISISGPSSFPLCSRSSPQAPGRCPYLAHHHSLYVQGPTPRPPEVIRIGPIITDHDMVKVSWNPLVPHTNYSVCLLHVKNTGICYRKQDTLVWFHTYGTQFNVYVVPVWYGFIRMVHSLISMLCHPGMVSYLQCTV